MSLAHNPQNDYIDAVAVTPADGSDLPAAPCRGLFFSATAGQTLKIVTASGTTTTFTFGPAGAYTLPVSASRVFSTGTTVTGIVALY